MATIVGQDGKPVPISDEELPAALASGKITPSEPIPMVSPDGDAGMVDPHEVPDAVRAGYQPTTLERARHVQAIQQAAQHPVEAAGVGAFAGLVPYGPKILQGLGGPSTETQANLKEGNPVAYGGGHLVGNIGQIGAVGAATAGLGAPEALGADLAGAAGKGFLEGAAELGATGAEAAAPMAAPAVAAPAATLASRLAGAVNPGAMAGSAATFGAQSVSNTINERELGDPEANAESLISQFGLGAITGGVGDAAFGLAREFLPNPISAASRAIAKASDKATDFLGWTTAKLRSDLVDAASEDAVRSGVKDIQTAAADRGVGTLAPRNAAANQSAKGLEESLTDVTDKVNDVVSHTYDELRPAEIDKHLEGVTLQDSKPEAQKFVADQIMPAIQRLQQDAASGYIDPGRVNKVTQWATEFANNIEGATKTRDLYDAGDKISDALDKGIMKYRGRSTGTEATTIDAIEKGIRTPLRQFMTNEAVFGKGAAEAEGSMNAAYHDLRAANDAILKKLGYTDLLTDERTMSGAKLQGLVKAIAKGQMSAGEGQELLGNYLGAAKGFLDAAGNSARNAGQSFEPKELTEALHDIVSKRDQAVAAQGLAWTPGGSGAVSNIAQLGLVHLAGGGPAAQAAYMASQLYRTARNPAMAAEVLGYIKRAAEQQGNAIARGVGRLVSGSFERKALISSGVSTVGALSRDNTFRTDGDRHEAGKSDYQKRADEIRQLAANPTDLGLRISTNTQRIVDGGLPAHATAVQQSATMRLQVLAAALPPAPPPSMLPHENKPTPPAPAELARFERIYATVKEPVKTLLDGAGDGTLTADMVSAAAQATPHTLDSIRQEITQRLMDLPKSTQLSQEQKESLSMLLGQPVSDQLATNMVAVQAAMAPPPAQPPGPQKQPKPRASGLSKLTVSEDTAFGPERMENAREA
jgi:hypothetical protein